MAGPLSGIAGQQQVPLAQQTQTNQNQDSTQVRDQDDVQNQDNGVQPQGAPVADLQETGVDSQDVLQQQIDELLATSNNGEDAQRGSLVDIAV